MAKHKLTVKPVRAGTAYLTEAASPIDSWGSKFCAWESPKASKGECCNL